MMETFARKIVRPLSINDKQAYTGRQINIENELRVMTEITANGGHKNIVNIFAHGRLNRGQYYLDMELCIFSLDRFINDNFKNDVGMSKYVNPLQDGEGLGCLTLWNIMRQIVDGLEFIHSIGELHRDLKPQNGTVLQQLLNNSSFVTLRLYLENH